MHHDAYGATIEPPKDDVGYTGHKFDTDLGLSYMQARYYDPILGRFTSNDPIGFRDIHSFNRYAYGNNNPYKFVDPDGRDSTSSMGGLRQGAQGAIAVGFVDAYQVAFGKHAEFATKTEDAFIKKYGQEMEEKQKQQLGNGIRHVAWQASITLEEGMEDAAEVGEIHENGNDSPDSQADTINNAVGRVIGGAVNSQDEITPLIEEAYLAGHIVVDLTGKDKRIINRDEEENE